MTAVAYNYEQLEAVFASVLQTAGPRLNVTQASEIQDIWVDIKKQALKPAVDRFVKLVRVAVHGVFTLDGNIAQIKSQWKNLFNKSVWLWTLTKVGSALVGLVALKSYMDTKLRTGIGNKGAANTAVFALIGFLASSLMLLKKDGERKTKLWETWEQQVDASDAQKKFIAKFKTMPAKIDTQLAKLDRAAKAHPHAPAAVHSHEQLEAVCASVVQTYGPYLQPVHAGALQDIWTDVKKKAIKPAIRKFVALVKTLKHGLTTKQGIKTGLKMQEKALFSAGAVALALSTLGLAIYASVAGGIVSHNGGYRNNPGFGAMQLGFEIAALCTAFKLLSKVVKTQAALLATWAKQSELSEARKKFVTKFLATPAKLDAVIAKLNAAQKPEKASAFVTDKDASMSSKNSSVALTMGGYSIEAVGSAPALRAFAGAPDFATEQVLRTSGSTVARKAFQELHNLMGDDRLTTAQKNHVAEAISSLKKIGPLKSEAGVAVALAKAPLLGATQMLKILTSIRDDADNEAQRKRMDNAIAVLKKNNPGL